MAERSLMVLGLHYKLLLGFHRLLWRLLRTVSRVSWFAETDRYDHRILPAAGENFHFYHLSNTIFRREMAVFEP